MYVQATQSTQCWEALWEKDNGKKEVITTLWFESLSSQMVPYGNSIFNPPNMPDQSYFCSGIALGSPIALLSNRFEITFGILWNFGSNLSGNLFAGKWPTAVRNVTNTGARATVNNGRGDWSDWNKSRKRCSHIYKAPLWPANKVWSEGLTYSRKTVPFTLISKFCLQ